MEEPWKGDTMLNRKIFVLLFVGKLIFSLEILLETRPTASHFTSSGRWPPSPDSNQEKGLIMKICTENF